MIEVLRLRTVFPVLAAAAAFAVGCRTAPRAEQRLLMFPPPPEKPRIQYLTWASGAEELESPRGAFADFILGEEPEVLRAIQKPYGIAVRDGVAYVCDTKALCICRLDFGKGTFSTLGSSGPGRLRKPLNIAIDALGYKFVVDSDRKQVVVFGPDDKYTTAFDVPEPCHPVDVATYENELYVLDNDSTCQIVVMDRVAGEVLRTIGEPGGEAGRFKIPNSIAVSPDGYLYVSDTHNWRVQKLTRSGEPVWARGQPGYMLGQFGRPRGIRVGPDGIVYVVDGATEIVQMFSPEGQTLMRFGGPGNVPGALGLPATLAVDASSIPQFERYIHEAFQVDYLLFVTSQYGAHLVSVYAYGSFPEGYRLDDVRIESLGAGPVDDGIGPVEPQATEGAPAESPAPPSDAGDG